MDFQELKKEIKKRSKDYSRNDKNHKCFVEEASGYFEGVNWTLNKLYQLGYINLKKDEYYEES